MTVETAVRAWLLRIGADRIAVAVSGGADSSALAASVCEAVRDRGESPGLRLVLLHYNHSIRTETEGEEDLRAVRALASRCGVPLLTGRAAPGRADPAAEGGPEAAARALRYRFLHDACRACGARVLATAHTRDDQAETVLMRLLDGLEGTLLAGIPGFRRIDERVSVHRPLLDVPREEIRAALLRRDLSWSEDRTNLSRAYRRNRVRHETLPELERWWPAVRHDLSLLAAAAGRLRERARERAATCRMAVEGGAARLARDRFFELDTDARLELLYDVLGRLRLVERRNRPAHRFFAPLLGHDPGREGTVIGGRGVRARLSGGTLVIEPDIVRSGQRGYLRVMTAGCPVDAGLGWSLTLARDSDTGARGRVVHLNRIRRPVVVRAPRSGDRVTGEGRSVVKLLADMGVHRTDRGLIPVVVDRDGVTAVLGSVLGYRDVLRPDGRGVDDGFLVVRSALE